MPVDRPLLAVLRTVDDPRLGRSIVELGMVKGATVERGTAVVAVALPLAPADDGAELRRRIVHATRGVEGVERVEVDLRAMDEDERKAVAKVLKGVSPLSLTDASAAGSQSRPRTNPFTESRTRVLAIASGKGGVGKSSVTTNLAIALARRGRDVAAFDADVWGFSMPRMLGVDEPPDLIDDVIVPPVANGVRLVSMGFFAREDQAVVWRGPMLHKALEQFLTDVHWGDPDYLVVDMPPGTGDVSISMAQFLPRAEVIVVTTPQPAAQKVAQRAAAMARKVNLSVVGVVENMSWFRGDDGTAYEIFGAGGGQELADELGVPLLGRVPLVPALREGGDEGRPIVVSDPDDEAARAFCAVAEKVDRELAPTKRAHPELRIT